MNVNDPLWPHFIPVWSELELLGCKACLIGGYALALKQRWLLAPPQQRTLISAAVWPESRTTQDMDVVLPIQIIGDPALNPAIHELLSKLGWSPILKHENWAYRKQLGAPWIKFEVHTPVPPPSGAGAKLAGAIRVKLNRKPPGATAIHGRANAEAIGVECGSVEFDCPSPDGTSSHRVRTPHPISLCMMKAIAAEDCHQKTSKAESYKERDFHLSQARKHVNDVGRAIAMTSQDERDGAEEVMVSFKPTGPYRRTCKLVWTLFATEDGWARQYLRQPQQWGRPMPPR